jgi:hypothetical protein
MVCAAALVAVNNTTAAAADMAVSVLFISYILLPQASRHP